MEAYICRVCLQSAAGVRLSRRDLSTFYAVCAMALGGYQNETSVWVCAYCWTRASQCLKFITLARKAEFMLRTNSALDIKPEEFHPYTFTRLHDTTVCEATECQILSGICPTEQIDCIVPIAVQDRNNDSIQVNPLPEQQINNELNAVIDKSLESVDLQKDCDSVAIVKKEHLDIHEDFDEFIALQQKCQTRERTMESIQNMSHGVQLQNIITERKQTDPPEYELVRLTIDEQKKEIEKKKQSNKYRDSKYKCICGWCFLNEDVYLKHFKDAHDESLGPYECNICFRRYKTQSAISGHSYYEHECRWRCMSCKMFVRKVNWKEHRDDCLAHSTEHECDICQKKFLTTHRLKRHKFFVHTKLKPFTCDYCKKSFKYKHMIVNHMRLHTGEKPYECETCRKKFHTMSCYKTHVLMKHTERRSEPVEKIYCVECDKFFRDKAALDSHLANNRKHNSDDKYIYACDTCSRRFRQESSLQTHINRVHLKLQNFPCTQCDKAYADKKVLASHKKKVHSGRENRREHVCDICGAAFKTNIILKQHVLAIHEKLRPYKCDICDATFGFKASLYTHNKLKHKGEKRKKKTTQKASTSTT